VVTAGIEYVEGAAYVCGGPYAYVGAGLTCVVVVTWEVVTGIDMEPVVTGTAVEPLVGTTAGVAAGAAFAEAGASNVCAGAVYMGEA
jgi:hypothetical protein